LAEGGIRDPELAEASITVTEADVSPDLRNVTYLVTPLGGFGDGPAMLRSLKRAAPFLRRRVAEIVNLKFAPEIRFRLDRSFDAAQRIESLLSKPEVRRDLEAPAAADESQPEKA
jgi:ribosome-binding factor A